MAFKRGMMGLESPSLSGREMSPPPLSGKSLAARGGAPASIQSAATTGAPPVKGLGAKVLDALRMRRRGMGARRTGRRL